MEEASSAPSESWDLHSLFSAAERRWNRAGSFCSATSSPKKQRIIFFDFDRTLTVIHVFKSLAGWVDSQVCMLTAMGIMVPRPHALTERGQLRRLAELGPAWTEQAFGGSHRITVLGELLEGLTSKGFSVMLITRGYIGVARHCLADAGLLGHFERVYGNVGAAYGERTDYDLEAAERHALDPALEDFLGRWDDGQWDSKNQLISSYMQTRKLGFKDIIFVDDDIDEIKVLKHAVSTVHVTGNGGMSAVDVQKILEMLEQETETWAQSCVQRWSAVRDPLASKPFAIVMFNRRHLPIRDMRHITLLEADFSACTNALRRVKMLLREPLLLWSVTQQAFVHHMATTVDRPFSLKALQPAIRGMHAHLLMEDESVARSLSANPNLSSMARSGSATFDSTFGFGEFQRQASTDTVDGSPEAPSTDTVDESPAVGAVGAGASGHLNLYSQPLTKSEPKQALRTLGSMVQMFQQALLGLCPITLNTAGLRRNVVACHEVRDVSSAVAVWARYEKLEMVGCGHFGEVFRAREVCNGREVAVKVLERLEHNAEEEEHGEVSVLRALAHPNLLRIFEVVKSKDEIHIITELASGGTLSGHARKHESTRGFWIPGCMQQITSALAYCHRLYVLHGDLKPENVLVCGQRPDGTPLCIVCDFGHTTVCIGSAQVAAPGDPRYIAPEVVAEQGLSPKSDIYMLGVTAFELLTGGWIPFFNEKSCTLRMSYYQLKVGGVREKNISEDGLDWRDIRRLQESTQAQVQEVVLTMLA
ncbi:unnamed protein product [Polarella glacialis]|uniref:non-specific serine/threonine protein kinase n=1 Tax=Polarella glacialis TaxID=89957 RepID=A0A813KDA6_POLGL|nr:unnamed protein product [Polarella glacialis]